MYKHTRVEKLQEIMSDILDTGSIDKSIAKPRVEKVEDSEKL